MSQDFYGFTFDGKHSSELGIVRVSGGDRYKDDLSPDLEDKIVDIPGNDGQYYFGSYFNKREFSIEIAYDNLTEVQLRDLKQLFTTRELKPLIFDERPYITYFVKPASAPELNYVCFDTEDLTKQGKTNIIEKKRNAEYPVLFPEDIIIPTEDPEDDGKEVPTPQYKKSTDEEFIIGKTYYQRSAAGYRPLYIETTEDIPIGGVPSDYYEQYTAYYKYNRTKRIEAPIKKRIYKGEGTITLVAYNPFGTCKRKTLSEYEESGDEPKIITNVDEWAESSKLLKSFDLDLDGDSEPDVYINKYLTSGSSSTPDASGYFKIYNGGDIETPPIIYIQFGSNGKIGANGIEVVGYSNTRKITWKEITKKADTDLGIIINCRNHLIEGVANSSSTKSDGVVFVNGRLDSFTTSGNIYNEFITSGDFFKIPISTKIGTEEDDFETLRFDSLVSGGSSTTVGVLYDYYYI